MKDCFANYVDYKEKIKTIFSTSHILKCHSNSNYESYKSIFALPVIKKMMKDDEIIHTAEQFLINDLNLTQAAKNSFMHRNTMIYRISNLQKMTGLNIKKFEDAQMFSNMMIIYGLITNPEK